MHRSKRISGTPELDPNHAALVVAAIAGDRQAQGVLFELHSGIAFRVGRRLLPHRLDLDDLVQDSIADALRALASLKDPRAFPSWFATIVVRVAAGHYRQDMRTGRSGVPWPHAVEVDELPSRLASADRVLELRELSSALARFPAAERTALLLRRVDGCRFAEIARRLGVSLATVRRRLRSAEARLLRVKRRANPPESAAPPLSPCY